MRLKIAGSLQGKEKSALFRYGLLMTAKKERNTPPAPAAQRRTLPAGVFKERLCIPLAMDGALLYLLKQELFDAIPDARVERVYQPSKEELVLAVRSRAGSRRLLLSCRASSPRIHFTTHAPENPAKPPMLCMLLRKHLTGAKLTAIRQPGLERVLFLDFDTTNELGDHVALTLAVEIMGRHSNLILIGEDGRIIDAVKRVDADMSSVRMVLPGMRYVLPPQAPGRMDLTKDEPSDMGCRPCRAKGRSAGKGASEPAFGRVAHRLPGDRPLYRPGRRPAQRRS